MNRQAQAYIYASATVLFWATVATAFKLTLRYMSPLQLLFYASCASALVLFAVLAAQGKLPLLRRLTAGDLLRSAFLGFLNPFLYYAVLFEAYSLLPAQQAQPINMTWPIVLVLLSIPILGQKIRARSILAIAVSFLGVVVISTKGDVPGFKVDSPAGVALALGSSVIWAFFWLLNVRDGRDEVVKLFSNFVFGCVFALGALLSFSGFDTPRPEGLLGAAYIGCFEMGVAFVTWLKALTLSRTSAQVGNLIYISPFLSLVPVHFIAGEKILPSSAAGLAFIVAGVLLQQCASSARGR